MADHHTLGTSYMALPVLTALAPSERYHLKIGKPHKKITDWARQMILQLRRWLPHRRIVVVADSSYAALDLLHFCQSMQDPSPSLPDCVAMPRSMNPLRLVDPARWVVRASRASACPHSRHSWTVPIHAG